MRRRHVQQDPTTRRFEAVRSTVSRTVVDIRDRAETIARDRAPQPERA